MTVAAKSRLGTRRQPERSRAAILKAAVREFSEEGIAGARTDAIARSAGVNKALLYYYFKDKEALYQAVLDEVFSGVRRAVEGALSQPLPPRDRLAAYARAHFDYIASNPLYSRIVHAELLRAARDPSRLQRIAKQYFQPVFVSLAGLLREGEAAGEFRPVDPMQFIPSMIAVIVFYFITAPITRVMTGHDPFSAERLASRREAIVDFVSHALFTAARPSHRATRGERN
ncbi:MAG TPA: TetR/AcrR family transcriptional regulator [Terriglobales bacterium]